MNKKIPLGLALTFAILCMTVTFSVTMLLAMRLFDRTVVSVQEKEAMYSKMAEIDKYVRGNAYYPIAEETLYDTISSGYMLGTGDKYARYYTASAYTDLLKIQNGDLVGIGVELAKDSSGYYLVTKVYEDSAAQEIGIESGCLITAVDGVDTKSIASVELLQARLRGETGTTVSVGWLDGTMAECSGELTRSGYLATTVDSEMLSDDVGYIRIRQFDSTTPSGLDYAIRSVQSAGASALVLDLRDNAGGILDQTLRCIDLVCPEGCMGYSESRAGVRTSLGDSSSGSKLEVPVVCLVNGGTASSAELFASCVRQLNGGLLVGSQTQGKGTIQASPHRLSDGSAVVITVARMLDSKGDSFDTVGLSVDVERLLTSEEEAVLPGLQPAQDPQVERAANAARYLASIAR